MFSTATQALLEAEGVTEYDLFQDVTADNQDHPQVKMAHAVASAANDLEYARIRLSDCADWVENAVREVRAYLQNGSSLNSLGVLQAQGPALDVATARVRDREEALTRLVEVYVAMRLAG